MLETYSSVSEAGFRLGVDIGGTFTDAALVDEQTGAMWTAKALTSEDPSIGALEAADMVVKRAGASYEDVRSIIHATTLVPNTLLQRRGATVGLVTNAGFEDIAHIAREVRYDTLRLDVPLVEPLVSRSYCRGISGRILSDGTEYRTLDMPEVRALLMQWQETDISSIAICLLHSYRNPVHEVAVAAAIRDIFGPSFPVSISSDVAPEIREYERVSTTLVNAYVQPVISGYLRRLEHAFRNKGYAGRLYVMLSAGGITTTDVASRFPARMLESGPAAGVLAATRFGSDLELDPIIAFDVGGTTAKACLVRKGEPEKTASLEVARTSRFAKGSGLAVQLPSIDLIEIGAGGGSIAHLDFLGLLHVGPQSAESRPGPACFGLGGTEPTVTDANVVLGYLNPADFAGGTMSLRPDLSREAVRTLASSMNVTVEDCALAVFELVSESMADAMRVHLAEKGQDPRKGSILASGGGGPLHATLVARKLGIEKVVIPARAGVLSAIGLLATPAAIDLVRSHIIRFESDPSGFVEVEAMLQDMEREATELLLQSGVNASDIRIVRSADMRWTGQTHSVTAVVPEPVTREDFNDRAIESFDAECARIYGSSLARTTLEALTWRIRASAPSPDVSLKAEGVNRDDIGAKGRPMWFRGSGKVTGGVFRRDLLEPGFSSTGPAVVEDRESTALIMPDDAFHIDGSGNLIISIAPNIGSHA